LDELLLDFYRQNGLVWGGVDLLAVGERGSLLRIGGLAAILRSTSDGSKPLFNHIVVVLPPVLGDVADRVRQFFAEFLERLRGERFAEGERDEALRPVEISASETLEVESLIEVFRRAKTRTAFVVGYAALFRSTSVRGLGSDLSMHGDPWAPHLHALMRDAIQACEGHECYVVLDAGEYFPMRQEHKEALFSLEPSAVRGAEQPESARERGRTYERWKAQAASGDLAGALSELESATKLDDSERTLIRLRLLLSAGFSQRVRAELEVNQELLASLEPERAVHAAVSAEAADVDDIAEELLAQAGQLRTARDCPRSHRPPVCAGDCPRG
jgi:hypothetical protein